MKKILFISAFAACAAMGLSSCMNGDYDANPLTVNSGGNPLIPINPGGGSTPGVAAKGEIRFRLNGSNYTLTGTYFDGSPRIMSGGFSYAGGEKQVGFTIDVYNGVGTYTITETDNHARYTLRDFNATPMDKDYMTDQPGGSGEIKVTSDANNEMIGTFHFTAFNNGEKVELTDGSFDLPKL